MRALLAGCCRCAKMRCARCLRAPHLSKKCCEFCPKKASASPPSWSDAMNMELLMRTCISQNASDIHIRVGRKPVLRVSGRLRDLAEEVVTSEQAEQLVSEVLPERLRAELNERGSADFAITFGTEARFRCSAFREKAGQALVLRRIPSKILEFPEIGLPDHIKDLLSRQRGLILVTGPTGSGKTTTLATLINEINATLDKHIVTIEDPIEYFHPQRKSIITQREVGVDVPDFSEAMRRVLRQDPDVIMLGEMRDYETISTAITAAETGHLVFGTLHTTGSARTVDRIIDSFPKDQQEQVRTQLALSIVAVISQVLMPRKGGGMVAGFELMINTPAIENYIRKAETFKISSDIQTGRKRGMILLDDHLLQLWREGKLEAETALEYAQDRIEMRNRMA
ncbi:MAG: type IV pilus twitching motility protein PilT [Planctomycetes bacterium]|nr:type IV pilus twitching motility protein PilT [Planctomycetota bacterium]